MKKNALGLAALFLAMLFIGGCQEEVSKPVEKIRPVRTVVVEPKPIDDDRQAIGDVRPRHEADLGFRVAGKLISRLVDIGVEVKSGDLIARLDAQDFQNKIRAAQADVASAQAVFSEANSAEERARELVEKRVIARSAYDAALRQLRTAKAKMSSAQASLQLATDQLGYTELRADFDGIVTAVKAEPGQVLGVGQTVIKLANPREKDAVFNIAETAFRDRKPGEHPQIIVTLLSSPNIVAEGVGREISPVADPITRTYQVKVTLNNAPVQMRFGSSVIGRLKTTTAPVVLLPGSALFDLEGKTAVWVFDKASSQVKIRPITVARYGTDHIVVHDGLKAGEIVVTAGVNRLREGQKVKLLAGAKK